MKNFTETSRASRTLGLVLFTGLLCAVLGLTLGTSRGQDANEIDYTVDLLKRKIAKLRELSPLWEMHQDGIDLNTVVWAAH